MSSFILNGFIDIRTSRIIQDRTLTGRAGVEQRDSCFGDERYTEDEREGFKGNNITSAEHNEQTNNNNAGIENRDFIRREEEIKRIFTTFSLHGELIKQLTSSNRIKNFDDISIGINDVKAGDYVKMHGTLTSESLNSYIDSMLNIFNCFGCESLDKIAPMKEDSFLNSQRINNVLNHLNEILNKNSTQDLILMCGNTPVVLNVNSNFFMNNTSYIFDKINCPCTVYGKVINVANNGQCISLLRKTAQHDFYEKLLDNCSPFCENLTSSGIILPTMPRLKCEGISLMVVPISICL